MDANELFVGIVTGAIGAGYLYYGKKQAKLLPAICGLGLMFYPYLVDNIWLLLIIGVALVAAPWVINTDQTV